MACNYVKAPIPAGMRSPSGEEAQIQIDGIARRMSLYMDRSDWELDWHIYLNLPTDVENRLRQSGQLNSGGLFFELMVVNRWEDEILGRQWWSDDMDGAFLLKRLPEPLRQGGQTTSEDWSLIADDNQGDNVTVAELNRPSRRNSALIGARVHLQGAFVRDAGHDPAHLEIHPLDSIAFAYRRSNSGQWTVMSERPQTPGWPVRRIRWRVAAFTNANFHRVNDCPFIDKVRTTVWFLDLPRDGNQAEARTHVTSRNPGFWDRAAQERIAGSGIRSVRVEPPPRANPYERSAFPVDPHDGRHKLRVDITMERPDHRGDGWVSGRFLRDFELTTTVGADAGPAVVANGPHQFDVLVRGQSGEDLVHRFYDGTVWSGWNNLGGDLASGPGVTAGGPHDLDVFVRGRHDDDLVWRHFDGTVWSGWINLGGDLASGPGVTAGGPHDLDVFVRGRHDDDLVWRHFDRGVWSGWINLGGDLASGPAVIAGGPHQLDVFVRGRHGDDLVHRFYDGAAWSGWINLGGDLASRPAVTAGGPHDLDVFVRGIHDDDLVWRYLDGGVWSGWINLGGDLASGPAVTADGPHDLDVFVRGRDDDDLVWRYLDRGVWSGWINLGGDLG